MLSAADQRVVESIVSHAFGGLAVSVFLSGVALAHAWPGRRPSVGVMLQ